MATFLVLFLRFLVLAVWLLVLGRALYSWIDPRFTSALGQFLYQMTEPMLAPIRRVLPQGGGIDFSPFVLIIVLGIVVRIMLV